MLNYKCSRLHPLTPCQVNPVNAFPKRFDLLWRELRFINVGQKSIKGALNIIFC